MQRHVSVLAFAFTMISAFGAYASDLPLRTQAPAPPPLPALYSWAGFYAGLHAGYGTVIDDVVGIHTPVNVFQGNIGNLNPGGFLGGGQLGYNFQSGNIVYGVEGDFTFTGRAASASGFVPVAAASTARVKTDWFGSVRGRVGYSFDRALFYVTGGVGFTDLRYSLNTRALASFGSKSATQVGGVAGAGIEYALTGNITARIEGLFYYVPSYTVTNTIGLPDFTKATQSHLLGRIGINYRF